MVSDWNIFALKWCKIAAAKKGLFAPTSRSPMSKLFRFLEFFGKSYGKKWFQIVKLMLKKGLKSLRKKKFLFWQIVFLKNLSLFGFLVIYHLSPVTCHMSQVNCHLSPVNRHLSTVSYPLLSVTCLLIITEGLDV